MVLTRQSRSSSFTRGLLGRAFTAGCLQVVACCVLHCTTTLIRQLRWSWKKQPYRRTVRRYRVIPTLSFCRYRVMPTLNFCRCKWRQYIFIPTDTFYRPILVHSIKIYRQCGAVVQCLRPSLHPL